LGIINKVFGKDCYSVEYCVDPEHDEMRLDQYIQLYLLTFSREHVKKKIQSGEIKIKGRMGKIKASLKLHTNEVISLVIHKTFHEDEYWKGEKLILDTNIDTIYEDQGLIVIGKPPYMATHPTGRHLFNCATVYLEERFGHTMRSVHRIDRETSGVLLLAKKTAVAQELTTHFENDRVSKCYFFMAKQKENYNPEKEFTVKARLGAPQEGTKRVLVEHFPEDSDQGKRALTRFKILHMENGYSLGLAFPQTGRQHQIRVHAMLEGFPLVGDKLYLGSYEMFQHFKDNNAEPEEYEFMELPRHALHAIALKIPYAGTDHVYQAPLPKDLTSWIETKLSIPIEKLEAMTQIEIKKYFSDN
jgi:23S rRNA pseudouridine1911/1915/1917 synthase